MAGYYRLEVPYYLLQSYAALTKVHEKHVGTHPAEPYIGHTHNCALLSLNAAIVEGQVKSLLWRHLFLESEHAARKANTEHFDMPLAPRRALTRLRQEVDAATWDKLKKHFNYLYDMTLSDIVSQPVYEKIEQLFTIRNIMAHGAAIQIPDEPVTKDQDDYLFALQSSKVKGLTTFLCKEVSIDPRIVKDIYAALGRPEVASLFWTYTKEFFANMEHNLPPYDDAIKAIVKEDNTEQSRYIPDNVVQKNMALARFPWHLQLTFNAIKNYEFGGSFRR